MSTIRVGSNEKYAENWGNVFGGKKTAGKRTAKKASAKKAAPKKKVAKTAKKR